MRGIEKLESCWGHTDGAATQNGTLSLAGGWSTGSINVSGTGNLNLTMTDNTGAVLFSGTIAAYGARPRGSSLTITGGATSINVQVSGAANNNDNFQISITSSGPMNNAISMNAGTTTNGSTTSTNSGLTIYSPVPTSCTLTGGSDGPVNYNRSYE